MAVGLTFVEPLAAVEVNVPGVMAMLVAPLVTQLSVLLEPAVMLVGLAVKELMTGSAGAAVTVTVTSDVADPAPLVAVSIYVVVAAGLTFVEPLEAVDVNVPGVMAMAVAPVTDQLSVLLEPEFMLAGTAAKEAICGMEPFAEAGKLADAPEVQLASTAQENRARASAANRSRPGEPCTREPGLLLRNGIGKSMGDPSSCFTTAV